MSIVARFLNSIDTATVLATASAVMIIAFQVAGKAVRDAFFLSNYDVTLLPVMLVAASAFSIVTVLLTGRAMSSLTPARFVPLAFLSSALLLLAEWQLSQGFPKVASVAVYFHIAALGGVLVSGFWSIVNERFDPRTAKKRVSWIGAGGAMGGLLGGVLAERVGASLSLSSMFPILSLIHLLCAGLLIGLSLPEIGRRHSERTTRKESSTTTLSGLQTLKSVPYLRNLALLVFFGHSQSGLHRLRVQNPDREYLSAGGSAHAVLRHFLHGHRSADLSGANLVLPPVPGETRPGENSRSTPFSAGRCGCRPES